jgi:RimJ/RimL family protein N-acetyltransferase
MTLEFRPISKDYASVILEALIGNVAEYFYNFKTLMDAEVWLTEATKLHKEGVKEEYVIFDGEQFIGMISPGFISDTEATIGIWISPNQQGKGYGKKALEQLLEILTVRDIKTVHFDTEPNNIASIKLAESVGFVRIFEDSENVKFVKYL